MLAGEKNKRLILTITALLAIFTSSCGVDNTTPVVNPSAKTPEEVQNKILSELEAIRAKLDNLDAAKPASSTPATTKPSASTPTTATSPAPTTTTPAIVPSTPAATTSPAPATVTDTKAKGRAILDKLVQTIKSANGIYAEISSYEKNLKITKEVQNELKLYTNRAKVVKMDVVQSSGSNTGVKVLYTSGDSGKVKVRPGGALSLVTVDMSKDDDRIVHQNGYRLDYTDFHGMASRLSDPNYQVELTGKTDLQGTTIYIMKITNSVKNSLDSRITYEQVGFDPKDYSLRLWEAYEPTNPSKPFIKFILKSITFRNISEEELKI